MRKSDAVHLNFRNGFFQNRLISSVKGYILCFGLSLFAIGNGLFKPNMTAIVGLISSQLSTSILDSFQTFFKLTNIGGIVSGITLGMVVHWSQGDFQIGFLVAALGMCIGYLSLLPIKKYIPQNRNKNSLNDNTVLIPADSPKAKSSSKWAVYYILIIGIFTISFWVGYQQMASSINLLIDSDVIDQTIFGLSIPIAWFQSITPFFNLTLTNTCYRIWSQKGEKSQVDVINKVIFGLGCSSLAFITLLAYTSWFLNSNAQSLSFIWLLPSRF